MYKEVNFLFLPVNQTIRMEVKWDQWSWEYWKNLLSEKVWQKCQKINSFTQSNQTPDLFLNSATEVKKNARCVPKGFFRRFGLGFFMFGLLVLMLAGSCFLVYFFSYKEAYIVKSISESKNVAIKGWILSQGNLNDIGSPKGYLRNYLDDKNKNEE